MAAQLPGLFTKYSLSEEEELSGNVLTFLQKLQIQNQLSSAAEAKVALVFDPANPQEFGIQVAYLAGKIDALSLILANSDEAESVTLNRATSTSNEKE